MLILYLNHITYNRSFMNILSYMLNKVGLFLKPHKKQPTPLIYLQDSQLFFLNNLPCDVSS